MPVSNPVIRRYTPPTCTLEVMAESSALSRWMSQSVLKELRFELRFDDPRQPEEKTIAIRGDRDQLEALYVAVTSYVQEFLQMSPESFWANFSPPEDISQTLNDPEVTELRNSSQQSYNLNSFATEIPRTDIHIKPSTHLTHQLFLGSLSSPTSGSAIQLSVLQLFDLATALDEYSSDVVALPNLNSRSTRYSIPAWAPVAAVLVIAAGLTPITWQYGTRLRQQQQVAKKTTQETTTVEVSPSPTALSSPLPILTPGDGLPLQQLPPLDPNLPTSNSPSAPTAQTFPILPPAPQAPSNPTFPTASQTSPNLANLPQTSVPSSGTTLAVPTTKTPSVAAVPQNPITLKTPNQKIAPQTNPKNPKQNSIALAPNGAVSLPPELQNPPSGLPTSEIPSASNSSAVPPTLSNLPNISSGGNSALSSANTSTPSDTDALITRLRQGRKSGNNTPTEVATSSSTSNTLFDTTQVAEAREFLNKRWQPPTGLRQPIEYSLLVGVDGSIERILPLGKAARDYVDRTGMPLIGEPFVSPNKNGQPLKIRAVFSPDGKVKTFPETD